MAELTKTWAGKWKDIQQIIEVSGEKGGERKEAAPSCGSEEVHIARTLVQERELALHSEGVKMMVASELPHFIGVDDDILSTGVVLYHLAVSAERGRHDTGTWDKGLLAIVVYCSLF